MSVFADEIWLAIPTWEGLYEVSSHGRVRALARTLPVSNQPLRYRRERMLRPWLTNGYPMVELQDKEHGRKRRAFVHRFVCEAFHGPSPSPVHEVAHGDGKSLNAHWRNLRWATHAENEADKVAHGTIAIGERHGCAKLTIEQAREAKASTERSSSLARKWNVSRKAIALIRNGTNWRAAMADAA